MTFSEFRSFYPDAFHDARGDVDWRQIVALLDDSDVLRVGQYLAHHFRFAKESLEDEMGYSKLSDAEHSATIQTERDRCLSAVNAEPELPGEMPDAMWKVLSSDRDAATEALRIIVRQTKAGIRGRILET